MFDERTSHRPIQLFIDAEYNWLDSLAGSSRINMTIFRDQAPGVTNGRNEVLVIDGKGRNPSLEVATRFGIYPHELPGVVFFNDQEWESAEAVRGIYWPMPKDAVLGGAASMESEIANLFSRVQRALKQAEDVDSIFERLKVEFGQDSPREGSPSPGDGGLRKVSYTGRLLDILMLVFRSVR